MAHHTPGRIFISYRREETAWPARTLYALLVETFGADQVFKDVDNIEPGDDFVERITEAVTACDILLAMIGPRWAEMTDDSGARRLDNPDDFVRIEIAVALSRGIRVVPILVDGARMPKASELPPDLLALTRRQAVEINPVGFSTERLLATMSETLSGVRAGKPVAEALTNALTMDSVTPAVEPVAEPPAAPVAPPAGSAARPTTPVTPPATSVTPLASPATSPAKATSNTMPPTAWSSGSQPAQPTQPHQAAQPAQPAGPRAWVPPTPPAQQPARPAAWVPAAPPAQQPAGPAWVPPAQPAQQPAAPVPLAWQPAGGMPPGPTRPGIAPKRSGGKILLIIGGVIAAIVVLGLIAASFDPQIDPVPSPSPSAVITPSPSTPSPSPTPAPGQCLSELNEQQCRLAIDVGANYIKVETCTVDTRFTQIVALTCDPANAESIKGEPTVYLYREVVRAELTKDVDEFFKRAGVKPGADWLQPPAKTKWFYRDDPDTTIGTLASANDKEDGVARVAWTYDKELIYAVISSTGGDAKDLIKWWSR